MLAFLIRRLLYTPLIVAGVILLTFVMFFGIQKPETVAESVLGKRATPQTVYTWMHARGLDKPVFFNYGQQREAADGHPYDSHGIFDTIFFHQMRRFAT